MPKTSTETVADLKTASDAAEVAFASGVVDWAVEHALTGPDAVGDGFLDTGVPLGEAGCPIVSEFAAYDLAKVLGKSSEGGCSYIGRVLETCYRLPELWARAVALEGGCQVGRPGVGAGDPLLLARARALRLDQAVRPRLHRRPAPTNLTAPPTPPRRGCRRAVVARGL